MGAYNSTGIFETTGIFMLSLKKRKYDSKHIVLYGDDGSNTSMQTLFIHHHF